MTRLNRKLAALRTTEPIEDKWWITLLIPHLVVGLQILAIGTLEPADYPSWGMYVWTVRLLTVGFFAALLLAIVGLYFDVIYVAEASNWNPSMWYSLMLFTPLVGFAIGLYYLYKRSKYVGSSVTSSPTAQP